MKEKQPGPIKTFRAQWAVMTFYERFEQVIALALSAIIAVIIVVSLLQLISIVFSLLVIDAFNPLDHKVFQTVFGMIMTLLIAMEFKHSIVGGLAPRQHHPGQDGDPDRADRPGAQVRDPRPGDQPRQDRGARRRDAGPRGDLLAAARAL